MEELCERLGGLWEDAGRPPNATVGIAFGGFGNGPSMSFSRTEASYDDRWSWIFDGVDGEVFGEGGLNSGAGYINSIIYVAINTVISLFVALETISIPTYVLAGYRKHDAVAVLLNQCQ